MGEETGSTEEIEEDLCVTTDKLDGAKCHARTSSDVTFRKDDVIVLEFGRPQRKGSYVNTRHVVSEMTC